MSLLHRIIFGGNDRLQRIASGGAVLVFMAAGTVFGVKYANGALDDPYQLNARFTTAGQGLIAGSDVKLRGVTIGRVKWVKLRQDGAEVRMDMEKGHLVPASASAVIRPKTLFGEKFVDLVPGDQERSGPYLKDEARITKTQSATELEAVLNDLYPILKAVRPEQLTVILDELSEASAGKGPQTNRTLANAAAAAHADAFTEAQLTRSLKALADLSGLLADTSPDILELADTSNRLLPDLTAHGDELASLLDQLTRFSGDVDSLLNDNRDNIDKLATQGGKTLQTVFEERAMIKPLLVGLRQFFEALSIVGDRSYGDGTNLANVKFVVQVACTASSRLTCGQSLLPDGRIVSNGPAGPADGVPPTTIPPLSVGGASTGVVATPAALPAPTAGAQAVLDLLGPVLTGVLGGRR